MHIVAPTAGTMQTLLDVCFEYGIDNDILFNPILFSNQKLRNYMFQ